MTATVACASDLLTHPDFLALCRWWESNYRCPLPMGDFLREQGLETQAAVADWCFGYRDRPLYNSEISPIPMVGPYPHFDGEGWRWYGKYAAEPSNDSDDIPLKDYGDLCIDCKPYPTFAQAVAALLDHYKPETL